jgi:mono/diheme cytochrome c family protein
MVAFWSLALGGLAGGGCTAESVPNVPTYENDVKPIMEARCIRCHGAGGMLNADPNHKGIIPGGAPFDGFFTRLEDDCPDGEATGCHGLLHYAGPPPDGGSSPQSLMRSYIHSTSDSGTVNPRMPPPPSPLLTTRELDVLDKWLSESPPQ